MMHLVRMMLSTASHFTTPTVNDVVTLVVTEELDAGPIIEQDIARVTHLNSIADFIEKGRDLERIVLLRALKLHVNRKVMVYGNKTVVFS